MMVDELFENPTTSDDDLLESISAKNEKARQGAKDAMLEKKAQAVKDAAEKSKTMADKKKTAAKKKADAAKLKAEKAKAKAEKKAEAAKLKAEKAKAKAEAAKAKAEAAKLKAAKAKESAKVRSRIRARLGAPPSPPPLEVGLRVCARWNESGANQGRWFDGVIKSVDKKNKTAHVVFDDGDEDTELVYDHISITGEKKRDDLSLHCRIHVFITNTCVFNCFIFCVLTH